MKTCALTRACTDAASSKARAAHAAAKKMLLLLLLLLLLLPYTRSDEGAHSKDQGHTAGATGVRWSMDVR